MSSDVSWHIRDKLRPIPKHGSLSGAVNTLCSVLTCSCITFRSLILFFFSLHVYGIKNVFLPVTFQHNTDCRVTETLHQYYTGQIVTLFNEHLGLQTNSIVFVGRSLWVTENGSFTRGSSLLLNLKAPDSVDDTPRASLSGTFLQRKEGCRKPVLGVCVDDLRL